MYTYTIVLTREEDGRYSVSVPALPGCHTWGDSLDHALQMAHDAISLHLEDLRGHQEPVPRGTAVQLSTGGRSLKAQLRAADRSGAP